MASEYLRQVDQVGSDILSATVHREVSMSQSGEESARCGIRVETKPFGLHYKIVPAS